jgi:uncharacterized protein with PQ loop repeat
VVVGFFDMSFVIQAMGWVGSLFFAISGIPQAVKVWRTKEAGDLSYAFLWLWLGGEWLSCSYVACQNLQIHQFQAPLFVNYAVNFAVVIYLLWAKWRY